MSRNLLYKYMAEDIAAETTMFLRLSPPLTANQVRDFLEPPLIPRENVKYHTYDDVTRELIAEHLMREFRRLNLWRN